MQSIHEGDTFCNPNDNMSSKKILPAPPKLNCSSSDFTFSDEPDTFVAAGNGCVLLACLMAEPESVSEEPELTNTIRQLIVDQMPKGKDGGSTGVIMIVNTLSAFCNFYQLSLGDLSVAIVAPVKKLIQELQTMDL